MRTVRSVAAVAIRPKLALKVQHVMSPSCALATRRSSPALAISINRLYESQQLQTACATCEHTKQSVGSLLSVQAQTARAQHTSAPHESKDVHTVLACACAPSDCL